MVISAPRVKRPIPTISRTEPAKNTRMVPEDIGTRITLTINTMNVIGSTDEKASIIFAFNIRFMRYYI
jgi:hypothetical protein